MIQGTSVVVGISLILITTATVRAEWQRKVELDRLTDREIVAQVTRGTGTIRQFGRSVSVDLILRCDNPTNDRTKNPDKDYFAAFLLFSEQIGIADTIVRYRFDTNAPVSRTFSIQGRGRAIFLSTIPRYDDFIPELRVSSKL